MRIVEKSRILFADHLTYFNWWAVSVGGEELKWRHLAHHQVISQQGPHFSPHSKAKAIYKSTNLSKIVTIGISDVVTSSVYWRKPIRRS